MIGIGITLPNYRASATAENIIETADRADRLGFHSVWVADHIVVPTSYRVGMGPVMYETQTTLSFVAGRTRTIKLGCSVMPTPYRHPLLQAKALATLDQLSGGRTLYGGASGYMQAEFDALGLKFHERAAMTDEYLEVIKLAWTQDVITFHGRFVDCDEVMSDPKPVQKPHPPIWLGGDSDGAFRRIIRFADGWHGLLGGSPGARREAPTLANFAERIARLRQLSEKAGRDPGSIALSVKATTQLGPETEHPFQGPASKIVESIKQLEQMGLEFVVLAPNTGPDRTGPELLDELATQVLGACR